MGNFVLQAKGALTLRKPYICSGGVATGRQLAAALALGAAGVNCGTVRRHGSSHHPGLADLVAPSRQLTRSASCVLSSTQRFAVTVESNWPLSFKQRAVAAEETATVLIIHMLLSLRLRLSLRLTLFRTLTRYSCSARCTTRRAPSATPSPRRAISPDLPRDLPRDLQASSPRPPLELPATSA